jgi:hypothetical protein
MVNGLADAVLILRPQMRGGVERGGAGGVGLVATEDRSG